MIDGIIKFYTMKLRSIMRIESYMNECNLMSINMPMPMFMPMNKHMLMSMSMSMFMPIFIIT